MGTLFFLRLVFVVSVVAATFLVSVLILKPATYRRGKFVGEVISDYSKKTSEIKKKKRKKILKRIILDFFPPKDSKLKRIDKLLRDLRITREKDATDIIFYQYTSFIYILGGIVLIASPEILNLHVSYNTITGIGGAVLIYTGYKKWVNTEKELKDRLEDMEYHFERDLALIFNLFYSRLKENSGYPLLEIIDEVKPNISGPSLQVLDILSVDVKMKGELEALSDLSNRFKSPYITKTSNLLSNRLRGLDNVVEMEEFIGKLRMHREFLMKDILKAKNKKVEKIKSLLLLPAFTLILLKMLAIFMQSMGKV